MRREPEELKAQRRPDQKLDVGRCACQCACSKYDELVQGRCSDCSFYGVRCGVEDPSTDSVGTLGLEGAFA